MLSIACFCEDTLYLGACRFESTEVVIDGLGELKINHHGHVTLYTLSVIEEIEILPLCKINTILSRT